jgi:aspartokinase-like uncharacterized kinase
MTPILVTKVGGSLYDLPDLRDRLQCWTASLPGRRVLFVPGGGRLADVIRGFDRQHVLGEERAHWLALRVLSVNAHFLSDLVGAPVLPSPHQLDKSVAVLDPYSFCLEDEGQPRALEHSWRVTSDSVAARVAEVVGGDLVLLKSVDCPSAMCWADAARAGMVDEAFPELFASSGIRVRWVNLRSSEFLLP